MCLKMNLYELIFWLYSDVAGENVSLAWPQSDTEVYIS